MKDNGVIKEREREGIKEEMKTSQQWEGEDNDFVGGPGGDTFFRWKSQGCFPSHSLLFSNSAATFQTFLKYKKSFFLFK